MLLHTYRYTEQYQSLVILQVKLFIMYLDLFYYYICVTQMYMCEGSPPPICLHNDKQRIAIESCIVNNTIIVALLLFSSQLTN